MATNGDQIVDKIRAILRKADESKNPSEEERDTALRLANRLLLKHGLSMADVGELDEDEGHTFEHGSAFDIDSAEDAWRGLLLHRIATVYFCKVYRTNFGRGKARYMLVGRGDYVKTTMMMFEFLVPQIEAELNIALAALLKTTSPNQQQQARLARTYAQRAAIDAGMPSGIDDEALAIVGQERLARITREQDSDSALLDIMNLCGLSSMHYAKKARAFIKRGDIASGAVENLAVWRRSFHDGAVNRIGKRLADLMREEVKDSGETGMALVRNEAADLDRFLDTLNLGLKTQRSARKIDHHGHAAGRAAGDRADINPGRKVKSPTRRQLGS